MATIEFDAPGYHVEITSSSPLNPTSTAYATFIESLARVDLTLDPISLDVNVSGSDFSYALVGNSSRTYSATLRLTNRQRKITGTSFWALPELLLHNPMIESVFGLLEASVTKIEVDWS